MKSGKITLEVNRVGNKYSILKEKGRSRTAGEYDWFGFDVEKYAYVKWLILGSLCFLTALFLLLARDYFAAVYLILPGLVTSGYGIYKLVADGTQVRIRYEGEKFTMRLSDIEIAELQEMITGATPEAI